jgi:glyoxylate reductase
VKVLVTQMIDEVGIAALNAAGLQIDVWPGPAPMPRATLLCRLTGCAGIIAMPTDTIDAEVMDAAPLQVIANHAVGVDNIDLAAAAARGIPVTNTPGVLTDATADLAMALLLAVARRVVEGHTLVSAGQFEGWRPTMLRGMELRGATLGIVGMGRIGQAVAARAQAFGMQIIHHSRRSGMPLTELLSQSDVVSLHCPMTAQTRHLIDADALSTMKSTALLINTARGPVVDEAALAAALRSGEIAGAGLDVFEHEPAVHPDLLDLDNAVLLPHLGSATRQTRRRMARLATDNLLAALAGDPLPSPVDLEHP